MIKSHLKYVLILFLLVLIASCSSSKETTKHNNVEGKLIETGDASWYGPNFHGRQTANGETFNQYDLTAAHRTLPFNSIVKVINKRNNKSVIVRINDRGPYAKSRIIDLSRKAAENIDMINSGHARVELYLLNNSKLPKDLKVPHYTVQVGSYKRKSDARNVSSKIDGSRIVEVFIDHEKYYRIYVGNFILIDDAILLKQSLESREIEGFVKQVEN